MKDSGERSLEPLETLPNFEAFEKWVHENLTPDKAAKVLKWAAKLKEWCELAGYGVALLDGKLENQKAGYEEQLENMEAAAKHWEDKAEFVDGLADIVADIDRGVKDMDDLRTHMETVPDSA